MNRKVCAAAIIWMLFLFVTAFSYDVNKDVKNLGSNAQDLAVELSGTETVTSHYDGYPVGTGTGKDGKFSSFSTGASGGNTKLHWQNFNDGSDNNINTNQSIHVGWSTADHSSNVRDMYWTDGTGAKKPGSQVFNITTGWTYTQALSQLNASWDNIFSPGGGPGSTVTITNAMYAVVNNHIPLDSLNGFNASLAALLINPVPGGNTFTVSAGGSVSRTISGVAAGKYVVFRYDVSAPADSAQVTDFVQVPAAADIPTLSEWALIIFSVLLLGLMTYYVIRRRQVAGSMA